MLQFHLKACPKCAGDLALDQGDWCCLQCGTYYYTRLYRRMGTPAPLNADGAPPGRQEPNQKEWHLPRITQGEPGWAQAAAAAFQFKPLGARDTGLTGPCFGPLTGVGSTPSDNSR